MKLIINRDEWLRGMGNNSCLLNDEGKRCCLGIYARAIGIEDSEILNVAEPRECKVHDKWPSWLLTSAKEPIWYSVYSTGVLRKLININDDEKLDEVDREKKIVKLFGLNGIEVEFE